MAELVQLHAIVCLGRQSSQREPAAMKDFLLNVTRYPRYLVAFGLGVANSVLEPLTARARNPVTAVALIGAAVSGGLSLALVLRAMVNTAPVA
jgi:hypothetical protein